MLSSGSEGLWALYLIKESDLGSMHLSLRSWVVCVYNLSGFSWFVCLFFCCCSDVFVLLETVFL